MWIYVNKPIQSLMYILEIDSPIEYPNQIPNDSLTKEKKPNENLLIELNIYTS